MSDSNSPLNMDKLNDAFMNNMDIIKQILGSFKESFSGFEEEFVEAQYEGNNELMSRLAHGLKGSAGNIRAEGVSSLAAELQNKIDSGEKVGVLADSVISSLKELLDQIDQIVD